MEAASGDPAEWSVRRRLVYRRDDYTCQECGAKGGRHGDAELHAHHPMPAAGSPSRSLMDLTTLCYDCHEAIHGDRIPPEPEQHATGATDRERVTGPERPTADNSHEVRPELGETDNLATEPNPLYAEQAYLDGEITAAAYERRIELTSQRANGRPLTSDTANEGAEESAGSDDAADDEGAFVWLDDANGTDEACVTPDDAADAEGAFIWLNDAADMNEKSPVPDDVDHANAEQLATDGIGTPYDGASASDDGDDTGVIPTTQLGVFGIVLAGAFVVHPLFGAFLLGSALLCGLLIAAIDVLM